MRIPQDFERDGLSYERIRPEHAAELEPMLLDDRVWPSLQYPSEPPPTAATVARNVAAKVTHWQEHGFGQWVVRVDGVVVGRGGLQFTRVTGEPETEIGWVTLPARWGQGIASRLAHAAVDAAFDRLGLDSVMAYTQPENLASQRVMAKAALQYERDFAFEGHRFRLYRRHREAGRESADTRQ